MKKNIPHRLKSLFSILSILAVTSLSAQELEVIEEKTVETIKETESKPKPSDRISSHKKPLKSWTLGVAGSVVHPLTDIRYRDFFGTLDPVNENQWGAQLRATKMLDGAFGIMFNAQYNRVQGAFDTLVSNPSEREYLYNAGLTEGVYFRSNVIQGSVNFYWNISNTIFNLNKQYKSQSSGKPIKQRRFSLYTYTGLGVSIFDPHVMLTENKAPASFAGVDFKDDRTTSIVIPFAVGTKFKISKTIDLGFEYGVNFLLTDRLDAFEYNHPSRKKNDAYSAFSVTLDFKLGTKKKDKDHLDWVNPIEPLFEDISKINRTVGLLTRDSDGDGVSDYFDKEKDTPEGVMVDGSGRAMDIDGDGIPDYMDLERFSDSSAEVDGFGISIDSDGDGIPDHKDLEPNTAPGAFVNFQGVTIEKHLDLNNPAKTLNFPPVYFDTDQSVIKRQYEEDLFMIARQMIKAKNTKFIIEGHCDERGSDEYNMQLGKDRAEAVKKYLVDNYKLDPARFEVVSKGKSQLDSPRFQINRRVDILVVEK
jgi:OmpA-OmpF porin, OOP family